MRDDMSKVIVERPRISAYSARKGRNCPLEDLPTREGMRRGHAYRGDRKKLNENLVPLRRYLERQVGRPWDKVYSEIAEHLRVDSAVQQHVRDHLRDFVAIKPRRVNAGWRSLGHSLWYQPLYVDSTTGLLCRTDRLPEERARRRRRKNGPAAPVSRIPLAPDRELRQIRGLWYQLELASLPEPTYLPRREIQKRRMKPYDPHSPVTEVEMIVRRLTTPAVRDVAESVMVEVGPAIDDEASWRAYRRAQPDRRYVVGKRMLCRRELRQYGLKNTLSDNLD